MVYRIAIALAFIFALPAKAQRDNVWIFGDSARLDFNQPGAVLRSNIKSNWSSATISNLNGSLDFYASTTSVNGAIYGIIYNSNDSVLIGGASLLNMAGQHFNIFLPYMESDSIIDLYTVSFHPFASPGLYRTRVHSGLNSIISSNFPIDTGYYPCDGVQAVRHGNGRDWWVIWKDHDRINFSQKRNNFRLLLVSSSGVLLQNNQSIGTPCLGSRGRIRFNKHGDRLALAAGSGLIEVYDFDRCSGLISSPVQLQIDSVYWNGVPLTCEFSQSGRFLYVSVSADQQGNLARILQYDLWAVNPASTKFTVITWTLPTVGYTNTWGLQLWLDDKIYVGTAEGFNQYPDTFYTPNITHLSRIEDPDQPGAACNFNLNCVYLNGARSYGSLPNNPNYALKEWVGSGCDTLSLTGLDEKKAENGIGVYPNPARDVLNIQCKVPLQQNSDLSVYSSGGALLLKQSLPLRSYRHTIDVSHWPMGLYLVVINSGDKVYQTKFQKVE